jgi:hypothetical protein
VIPRYQRVIFYSLIAGSFLMALLLIRGCERDRARIASMRDQSPIPAPTDIPDEPATIASANDADGTISLDNVSLPLPSEPTQRARVLLARVLADDTLPRSTHPLPAGPAITDVFLLTLPVTNPGAPVTPGDAVPTQDARQLAVINLTRSFADAHPSGITVEDLTLRQLLATLQANFPQIDQVRFLIEGQPADTLAGHADLTRAYAITDPTKSIHVVGADGKPL